MIETERLPQIVIEEDHRLESAADKTAAALMEHRWHWTLDESNSERIGLRAYAQSVSRTYSTIHASAHGFVLYRDRLGAITPSEARERAKVGAEKEIATEAVAQARGQSFGYIGTTHRQEVEYVRDVARENAEKRGTSVEEEAQKFAQFVVKYEKAKQLTDDERRAKHDFRFFELEGYLANALRYLAKADKLAGTLAWNDLDKEILADIIEKVEELTHHIDRRIAGMKDIDIDWDHELGAILAKGGEER